MNITKTAMMAIAALCLGAIPAGAEVINFSGAASDNDAPLSNFDAAVEYTLSGTTLTMTFFNNTTDENDGYTLSVFGFNVSDDVADIDLILDPPPNDPNNDADLFSGISLSEGWNGGQGGFGAFDWRLDFGQGNNGLTVPPGEATLQFAITADAGATLDIGDFFSHGTNSYSDATAIIHFTRGDIIPGETEGDDSAWVIPGGNSVVPEPATAALMGLGVALLASRSIRRKNVK